ncbi:MAG: hypothetical protein QF662_02050, partial [Phycisphaerae bacterium]|nr:hypothetical protein [Phycisphaerae bacterium]
MKGKENITVTPECLYHCLLERPVVTHLDGQWRFKVDRDNRGEDGRWFETGIEERKTIVPSSWQAVFEDLRDYCGVAW